MFCSLSRSDQRSCHALSRETQVYRKSFVWPFFLPAFYMTTSLRLYGWFFCFQLVSKWVNSLSPCHSTIALLLYNSIQWNTSGNKMYAINFVRQFNIVTNAAKSIVICIELEILLYFTHGLLWWQNIWIDLQLMWLAVCVTEKIIVNSVQTNWQKLIDIQHSVTGLENIVHASRVSVARIALCWICLG